jgi:electron transfer flavoprotein beta subunit
MQIVVILGRVLDPKGIVVKRKAGRIFVNREEYILQPADLCALEAALRVKDSDDTQVVALPRSLLPDADVLRQALAMGADRAVHLASDGLERADDAVMARVLAAAVERLGDVDLVLAGATLLDTAQGQLGPRIAQILGWPQIVGAWQVEVADGTAQAVRRNGDGYVIVEANLPAVVTVAPGALKPRYADGVRLVNVYKQVGEIAEALETWDVSDLVDEAALQPLLEKRGQDFPLERERGLRLGGEPEEMAQALADALKARAQGGRHG